MAGPRTPAPPGPIRAHKEVNSEAKDADELFEVPVSKPVYTSVDGRDIYE